MDESKEECIQISYVFWYWVLIAIMFLTGLADISGLKQIFDVSVLLCLSIISYLNLHKIKKKMIQVLFWSLPFIVAVALLSEEVLQLYGYQNSLWFGYMPGITGAAVIIAITVWGSPIKPEDDIG